MPGNAEFRSDRASSDKASHNKKSGKGASSKHKRKRHPNNPLDHVQSGIQHYMDGRITTKSGVLNITDTQMINWLADNELAEWVAVETDGLS